jgi:hypothetical protein
VVPPISDRISRVPPYSWILARITRTGLSPNIARLSRRFRLSHQYHWPGPGSLATTAGVSVDVLSYGYLDVSVPRVRFFHPMYSGEDTCQQPVTSDQQPERTDTPHEAPALSGHRSLVTGRLKWVSPFGNLGIKGYSHLPRAYRSVSRPSSPVHAKASTSCP